MSDAPAVLADPREAWLARRRELVTASDAAAILGYDKRRGPIAVYAEKVGALPTPEDEDWLAFGRDVEGAIAKGYTRKTGRPARDLGGLEIQTHPDIPWLGATLDRMTEGSEQLPAPAAGPGPLELKAVGGKAVAEWKDDEPVWYVIQLHVQMAVTGAAWGSLAPMFHGLTIEARDHLRNDRFLANALPRLEEFHLRVKRREPPTEVDELETTTRAIKSLFPTESGATIALDASDLGIATRLEAAQGRLSSAAQEVAELENALRLRMATASFGALPDGSFLTLKTTKVRGYVREVEPNQYRALRRWRPRLPRR